jgi:hypothetical protein
MAKLARKPRLEPRVSDIVRVPFGTGHVDATVIEDRGHIGFGGRRLLRVRVKLDSTEPFDFELGAEEVTLVETAHS